MSAEIPDGAVIVARAILNSSLWNMRPEDRVVAITCIALCNYQARDVWLGSNLARLERGQFARSWQNLAHACNLSVKRARTSITRLEKSGFLARKQAGRYSIYTLPKYDFYQNLENYSDSVGKNSGKSPARGGQRDAPGDPKIGQDVGNRQERRIKNKKKGGDVSTPRSPFDAVAHIENLTPSQAGTVLQMLENSGSSFDKSLMEALQRKAKDGTKSQQTDTGRQPTPA